MLVMGALKRRDQRGSPAEKPAAKGLEARVRRDLEQRGLDAFTAGPVSARIAPRAAELSGGAYGAFLDGVAATQAADRDEHASATEIQRLVQDFAIELKKLDEGLRLLSTFLLRIRDRAASEQTRVVH